MSIHTGPGTHGFSVLKNKSWGYSECERILCACCCTACGTACDVWCVFVCRVWCSVLRRVLQSVVWRLAGLILGGLGLYQGHTGHCMLQEVWNALLVQSMLPRVMRCLVRGMCVWCAVRSPVCWPPRCRVCGAVCRWVIPTGRVPCQGQVGLCGLRTLLHTLCQTLDSTMRHILHLRQCMIPALHRMLRHTGHRVVHYVR